MTPIDSPSLALAAVPRDEEIGEAVDGEVVYGLLRMGDMDVALPLSALREVVPCPPSLAGLPAAAPGLLGALELRRIVLPVLDLHAVLGRSGDRSPGQVVVVVAWEGQVLGLLADEVRGICQLPADALVAARTAGGRLLFSHTFRHPETGGAYSVLDADAILALPGVPTVTDVTRLGAAVGAQAAGRPRRTLTVLRCGGYRFAIDAVHVHTTLPTPQLRSSVLASRLCRGAIEFSDREVPVIDPLALLGLGELPRVDTGAGLVLDGTALMADPDLTGFASVNTALDSEPTQAGDLTSVAAAAASGAPPYLTLSIGVDIATPLAHVTEILPYPDTLTVTSVEGLLGLITHRRAAVPVLCLATLLGRPETPVSGSTCLLLVDVDGAFVAFAVHALRTIAPRTWTDEDQTVRGAAADRGATLRSASLIRVGEDSRLLPDLDLRAVARRLQRHRVGSPSPSATPTEAQPTGELLR